MECCKKGPIEDCDFPLKVERASIRTRQDTPIATAESEQIAKDIVDRLNEQAWQQLEDQWNL